MSNSKRPLRELAERGTSKFPSGPLNFIGEGDFIGGVGFFSVAFINGIVPINGVDVGFEIESHSIKSRTDGNEIHEFIIHAASSDVARFAAKYRSSPSNIQFLSRYTEVIKVEEQKSNRSFSRWFVRVEVVDRQEEEDSEILA